jgi:DNA-binding transcriptional MerR regulator
MERENQKFYKISEFAEMVGVTAVTLRNWEKRGFLTPHHVSPTGYRYYTEKQLEELINGNKKKLS